MPIGWPAIIAGTAICLGSIELARRNSQKQHEKDSTGLSSYAYQQYKTEWKRELYKIQTYSSIHNSLQFIPRYQKYCVMKKYQPIVERYTRLGFPYEDDLEAQWLIDHPKRD